MKEFLERISQLSPKRLALLAAQLQSKVEALEAKRHEPIAIIGIGCRFPGGANDPSSFWQLLRDGVDAVEETPTSRWDLETLYDPNTATPGKLATRWGAFLEKIDEFDPDFFGISPREAVTMDPQQRLLLEVAWEALEHTGCAPDRLMGSRTGVFVGVSGSDYFQLQLQTTGREQIDAYLASGSAHSVAAGRLSYFFDFQGPSIAIDTACSSSLVAIHMAVRSLRNEECRMAIAGGVNVLLAPETTMTLSKANMMAADGRCKTFDARADGFVRGEGCGLIVLKRLADAQADGDTILAVIRGSAVNQDGRSNGLTAPNGPSQETVIRAALADGGVAPQAITFVETHGTGTALGDPIEVQALGAVLCCERREPLLLGSVKTNIGHLESAAGVAGLIKTVLALQHGEIPPHLHLGERNPYIPWERFPAIAIPQEPTAWQPTAGSRLAGVSSFGFGGTNAHVILEEGSAYRTHRLTHNQENGGASNGTAAAARPQHLLALSAHTAGALQALVARYTTYLQERDLPLADLCHTANSGRSHHKHRIVISAAEMSELQAGLVAYATGEPAANLMQGQSSQRPPKIAFLFTGQGAQYPGMGRQLYATQPLFRRALERCDELLRAHLERPLLSVLYAEDPETAALLHQTIYAQPALFAFEYALAMLWQAWGIRPTAVMGHSVGELAAACVAGLFSLEDGLRLVAERGRLMQQLPAGGVMAVLFADEKTVAQAVAPYADRVAVAAINGPSNVVISGAENAVAAVLAALAQQGVRAQQLTVSHAFHSPLIEPALAEFELAAASLSYAPPQIELISNLTGRVATTAELNDPHYWYRHARQPVRFADAMQTLANQGYTHFIEIGPTPTLLSMAQRCLPEFAATWLPSLRKGRDEWQQITEALATLYVQGVNVDWQGFDEGYACKRVPLPTYPFQRQRCWVAVNSQSSAQPVAPQRIHPMLGWRVRTASNNEVIFENSLDIAELPFLRDHRIHGHLILPSPAYLEMALAAAAAHFGPQVRVTIHDLVVHRALLLPNEETQTVQLVLTPHAAGSAGFQIYSWHKEKWWLHADGKLTADNTAVTTSPDTLETSRQCCDTTVPVATYYEQLRALGLDFGPTFQGVTEIRRTAGAALAQMALPAELALTAGDYHTVHPALLDCCLHMLGAAFPVERTLGAPFLLFGADRLHFDGPLPARFWTFVRLRSDPAGTAALVDQESFTGDLFLFGQDGQPLAHLEGLHLKRARPAALLADSQSEVDDLLYEDSWWPQPAQVGLLPTPERLAAQVEPRVAELVRTHNLMVYDEAWPQLDQLCTDYIVHALAALGWQFTRGQSFVMADVAAQTGILSRHHRLLGRMLQILAEDGYLRVTVTGWTVTTVPPTATPQVRWQALLARYPALVAELQLTGRCGNQLADALRGRVDPLQLLFPGGSLADTERLYQDSPSALVYNGLVRQVVIDTIAALPPERPLRILEIGAGTGGTTSFVLPILPPARTTYTFTDVSPLFMARAQEKFSTYAFVQYQLLDISNEPGEQGFLPHQFDLIIAVNVLHATPDLQQTLTHVQELLVPGGLLLAVEGTTPQRFGDLTVGLTDGWWSFADRDRRPDYALLDRARWFSLLAETGFSTATALPNDQSEGILAQQALLLARAPARQFNPAGSWLIFADQGQVGRELANRLQAQQQATILITRGEEYQIITPTHVQLDPTQPADFQRLVREMLVDQEISCQGVINLWPLDATMSPTGSAQEIAQHQLQTCGSTLYLVQALAGHRGATPPGLWLVTRGVHTIHHQPGDHQAGDHQPGAPVTAVQTSLWGLSRVIELEHPELRPTCIDLDPAMPSTAASAALFAEIRQEDDNERQVTYRRDERLVRRLVRHQRNGNLAPITFRPDRTYLITGGLKGLGLLVAEWLVLNGARHLVLIGRAAPAEAALQKIAALREKGAQIQLARGDISQQAVVASLLTELTKTQPPLCGIFHAAGALDDGVLLQQSWERFERVMAAKVQGTWHLHNLTQGTQLDFMVFFSSGASFLGSAGQGNHAAANAFMDGLAHFRQAQNQPTISINWGAWAEVGAAVAHAKALQSNVAMFSPQQGLQALGWAIQAAIHDHKPQLGVIAIDWPRFLAGFPAQGVPRLFERFARETAPLQPKAGSPGRGERQNGPPPTEVDLRQRLATALPNRRPTLLLNHVRQQAAHVLGLAPESTLDPHRPLQEVGLDSLMAVELRNKLGQTVGQTLPATLLFEYPTLATLVNYLTAEILHLDNENTPAATDFGAEETPPEHITDPSAFNDLSEDNMAYLLMEKLAKLDLN